MAESPLERLKRLAAEKKAGAVPVAVTAQPVVQVVEVVEAELVPQSEAATGEAGASAKLSKEELIELVTPNTEANLEARMQIYLASLKCEVKENESPKALATPVPSSNHPLAMQFAELEAALLAQQPEFKTILREIHRHLGQEPELVTMMTEEEIQMVVSGLVVFANAEIVAPAAAKTAKAKIKEASKKVISADDL